MTNPLRIQGRFAIRKEHIQDSMGGLTGYIHLLKSKSKFNLTIRSSHYGRAIRPKYHFAFSFLNKVAIDKLAQRLK